METIKTVEEFVKRLEQKQNVSRFKVKLDFRWNAKNSEKLRYANLSSADLSSADLSSADLSYANLSYANLSSADLSYANLSYANLSYANLSSADLYQAKGTFVFNFGAKLSVQGD